MGLIGLEPMTLRLSSACSNQLSYRPVGDRVTAFVMPQPRAAFLHGGKGVRTPDIQLAKLALYQLSYAPALETFSTPGHVNKHVMRRSKN